MAQLQAVSSRWLSPGGDIVTRPGHHDKLAVIFSHHTIGTMGNVPAGSGRIGGDQVAALLLRYPNAVLWVNGHTHRNQVIPHARCLSPTEPAIRPHGGQAQRHFLDKSSSWQAR